MARGERVLVPVEDKGTVRRVIDYVGSVIAERSHVSVYLFHRLPPLPPQLREHGGSEDPERERQLRDELERAIDHWVNEQTQKCRRTLNEARERLIGAGVPADAVHMEIGKPAYADEAPGAALRRAAKELGCGTVVLPHEHTSALRDIFRSRGHSSRGHSSWGHDQVWSTELSVWLVG